MVSNYNLKMGKIINWIKKNKIEFWGLVFILGIATLFRFYKINEVFYFVGDAGRDAQVAYKIIFDHKLTLIGPKTSVGGFYLGPFYFYLITIPLFVFSMNPLGLGYLASFLGVVAVFLAFLLGKILFNGKTGLIIAFLYATSSIVVSYSRTAWNPSPIPIFTLLLIIFTYLYEKTQKSLYLWFLGFVFGIGVQLHYNFIFLAPPAGIYLLFTSKNIRKTIKNFFVAAILFILANFPLVLFELRHQFITSRAFLNFLKSGDVGGDFIVIFDNFYLLIKQTIELTIFSPRSMPFLFLVIYLFAALSLLFHSKKRNETGLLFLLFFLSAFCFSFFKGTLQLYYLNFLLPFPILFVGIFLSTLLKKKIFSLIFIVILIIYFANNWAVNINLVKPNPSFREMMEISRSIVEKVPQGQKFNIAIFSGDPWHSAEEYRYFSYYFGKRALGADNYRNIEKLYIISSGPMENPLAIRSQETGDFGARKIEDSWSVGSFRIFQLSR